MTLAAQAQEFGGRVLMASDFAPTDMITLSQYNYIYGTARSSAMGGAFSSLGADMASMTLNPAGLGMYLRSEASISLSYAPTSMSNTFQNGKYTYKSDRFLFNNAGAAINVFQGGSALTSVTLGFGYNVLANFYGVGTVGLDNQSLTIGDVFAQSVKGIPNTDLRTASIPWYNNRIQPNEWGGTLAYQTWLIDNPSGSTSLYEVPQVGNGVKNNGFLKSWRDGYVSEYSFAMGMNFSNVVYFGLSIGLQDIYYEALEQYEEEYINNPLEMNGLYYDQRTMMAGTGVNAKFGVIVRPLDMLRLGISVQTPTRISVDRVYNAEMTTFATPAAEPDENIPTFADTYDLEYTYKFNTPARLNVGASVTLGEYGILSVDYEKVWYDKLRLRDKDSGVNQDFADDAAEFHRAADNVRAGIELRPSTAFSVRGGFGYYGSPLADKDIIPNNPVATETYTYSAGLGYRFRSVSFDLTYSHLKSNYSAYDLWYYNGEDNDGTVRTFGQGLDGSQADATPDYISQLRKQHNIIFTASWRF